MADNKQYITQMQDDGSVLVSEDVIAAIVAHAAGEVEGVVSLNNKPGADIAEFIGKKNKGIKITVLETIRWLLTAMLLLIMVKTLWMLQRQHKMQLLTLWTIWPVFRIPKLM